MLAKTQLHIQNENLCAEYQWLWGSPNAIVSSLSIFEIFNKITKTDGDFWKSKGICRNKQKTNVSRLIGPKKKKNDLRTRTQMITFWREKECRREVKPMKYASLHFKTPCLFIHVFFFVPLSFTFRTFRLIWLLLF